MDEKKSQPFICNLATLLLNNLVCKMYKKYAFAHFTLSQQYHLTNCHKLQ